MRKATILAFAIVAAASVLPGGAQAERYYPWCAWYDDWTSNCGFTTLRQCMATVSGVGGICKPNPYGPPLAEPRHKRWR
jgi:hypothetical protein